MRHPLVQKIIMAYDERDAERTRRTSAKRSPAHERAAIAILKARVDTVGCGGAGASRTTFAALDELDDASCADGSALRRATGDAATGTGWLEVRVGEGGLTLADGAAARAMPARLEPHLVRSAAGKTMLLLVGTDERARAASRRCATRTSWRW